MQTNMEATMTRSFTLFAFLLAATGMACDTATVQDDAVDIESALSQDFGALTDEDEDPMFDDEAFEDLGEAEEDPAEDSADDPNVDDAIDDAIDPTIPPAERPIVYAIAVTWGRRVLDTTAEEVTVWNPTLSTDCGVIAMRRRIRLEPGEGVVRPRESAQAMTFNSATMPHFDGALVVLAIPADQVACAETGMLRFDSEALDAQLTVPLDPSMANLVLRHELGDGNEVIAIGHALEPVNDGCVHGFIVGRWVNAIDASTGEVEGKLGRFYGRVMGPLGGLRGHIKGIYGVPQEGRFAGKQVLFGKYINTDGEFRGILAGRYGLGLLGGGWHLRPVADPAALKGLFVGQYASMPELVPDGGLFRMRYGSVECINTPDQAPLETPDQE
jgi:hypothetical protein